VANNTTNERNKLKTAASWYFHLFPLSFQRTALVLLLSAIFAVAHVLHMLSQEVMKGCLILWFLRSGWWTRDQGSGGCIILLIRWQKCIRHAVIWIASVVVKSTVEERWECEGVRLVHNNWYRTRSWKINCS
jgi:hypothetical protein